MASWAILVQTFTLYKTSPTMGQGLELKLKELILSQAKIGQLWGINRGTPAMERQDYTSLFPWTRRVQTIGNPKKLRKARYAGIISSGETVTLRKHMDFLAATLRSYWWRNYPLPCYRRRQSLIRDRIVIWLKRTLCKRCHNWKAKSCACNRIISPYRRWWRTMSLT
jgi:hypothetical protein